jgi:hypothetical protein
MRHSDLFVPPRLVERRRVALSPDLVLAWNVVGLFGLLLLAAGAIDVVFRGMPGGAAGAPWQRGLPGLAERAHIPVLGLGMLLASCIATGRRRATRAGAGAALLLSILLFIAATAHFLGAPAVDAGADPATLLARRARLHLGTLSALYAVGLGALAIAVGRHVQRHEYVSLKG